MSNLEAELPEIYLATLRERTGNLLQKVKEKLSNFERKLREATAKIAQTIRKYWQCLILSGKILVFVMKKIRGEGYLNCEKN